MIGISQDRLVFTREQSIWGSVGPNASSETLYFRAGWMMGGGPKKDKKFINLLMKQLANGVTELNVVNDKLGTPTYTVDFALISPR